MKRGFSGAWFLQKIIYMSVGWFFFFFNVKFTFSLSKFAHMTSQECLPWPTSSLFPFGTVQIK